MAPSSLAASTRDLHLRTHYVLRANNLIGAKSGPDGETISISHNVDDFLGVEDCRLVVGTGLGLEQVRGLRLDRGLVLSGEVRTKDETWVSREIDLNEYVFGDGENTVLPGFKEAIEQFVADKEVEYEGEWLEKVKQVRLVGHMLKFEDNDGAERSVDLSRLVRSGYVLKGIPSFYDENGDRMPPELLDTSEGCWERIVALHSEDSLELAAKCRREDGSWTVSSLDLTGLICNGPNYRPGKLAPLHLPTGNVDHTPQTELLKDFLAVDDVHLDGTKLCGYLQGYGPRFHYSSLELARLLKNDDGKLVTSGDFPFCRSCRPVFLMDTFYRQTSGVDVDILNKDAMHCPFCGFLRNAYETHTPPEHTSPTSGKICTIRTVFAEPRASTDQVEVTFMYRDNEARSLERHCQLYNVQGMAALGIPNNFRVFGADTITEKWNDSVHFRTLPTKQIPQNCASDPDRSRALARQWIDECAAIHQDCPGLSVTQMPSRILEIGGLGSADIRISTGPVQTGEYACLSHCWGEKDFITLKQDRLGDFSRRIPQEDLPPTFVNAVAFCRSLGIRYLWIDALCIIQDSTSDWQRESAKMNQYYTNCTVCLAATTSSNDYGGCELRQRPPIFINSGQGLDNLPYQLALLPAELRPNNSHFEGPRVSSEHFRQRFPLLTRGWAYQERRLSPRVLHFCDYEVMLECTHGLQCECGGIENVASRWTKGRRPWIQTPNGFFSQLPGNELAESIQIWQADVVQFSRLRLTYTSDRLPAISGLAKVDEVLLGMTSFRGLRGNYLAGVWEGHLPCDLMWRVGNVHDDQTVGVAQQPKPDKFLAPSWSWASVLDGVDFWTSQPEASVSFRCSMKAEDQDETLKQMLITIHSAETFLAGHDPTGQVTDGFLDITGEIIKTAWSVVGGTKTDAEYRLSALGLSFLPDYDVQVEGTGQLDLNQELFLLPIHAGAYVGSRQTNVFALVLKETANTRARGDNDSTVTRESRSALPKFERVGSTTYPQEDAWWGKENSSVRPDTVRMMLV